MVVCDFSTHTPHVKKLKFSPHIRTWKLMDPATASQFQSAFKIKMMTAAAAVATTSGADAHTANHLESAWSKLKAPCWMLPPKFVVSQRTTSGNQKPDGGMKRWTKLYERSMHGSRPTMPWSKELWRQRLRGKKLPTWCQARGKTCHLADKVWGGERGIHHSIPTWWWCFLYSQTDVPQKQGHRWWELCLQWCWWACAH